QVRMKNAPGRSKPRTVEALTFTNSLIHKLASFHLIYKTLPPRCIGACSYPRAPDLFHRFLRPEIRRADPEDNAVHELECMREHQLFHFAIVNSTPMRPRQKRPTNLNLVPLLIISIVARRTNDSSGLQINCQQGPAGFHCFPKELPENVGPVTIIGRMLLPDQRIGRHCEKPVKILDPQR